MPGSLIRCSATYGTLYFEARDVLVFLGGKMHGNFPGAVVTDQLDFSQIPQWLPREGAGDPRKTK